MIPAASQAVPVVFAPFIGSYLGVLVRRLPAGRPVVFARSACEQCQRPLSAIDLVPVLSYVVLRGRCRSCHAPIDRFHPAIELAAVAVAIWAAMVTVGAVDTWIACGLGWTLLTLSWIDVEWLRLPDVLTLPLVIAGLATALVQEPTTLADRAIGAAAGYLALWAVAWCYRRLRGHDGLGIGDAKLLAAGGAWLGWYMLPWVLLLASLLGLCAVLAWRLMGHDIRNRTPVPFGPFLAAAIWVIWLHGQGLFGA